MMHLAFCNLFQNRARLVISIGGVALALMLILALDAIFAGVERQVTAYINHTGADVFVAQSNVRNMHMATSWLPRAKADAVRAVAGVESVTPILYVTNMVIIGDERNIAYIIGLPEDAGMGGPWEVVEGSGRPGAGEAVVDGGIAKNSGAGLGDEVKIMGRTFEIVGLSGGTATLSSSVAFISMADFAELRGSAELASFLLVKVKPSETPPAVAARIEAEVADVTSLPRTEFAGQEQRVIKDMSTDLLAMMNFVGLLIGLAVMALTVYTATLARRAEYGVLKALGARNGYLYGTVLTQALLSVVLGFGVGLAFTLALAALMPRLSTNLALDVSSASLLKVGGMSLAIAGVSALLPIRQLAGLDPAMVFRGK